MIKNKVLKKVMADSLESRLNDLGTKGWRPSFVADNEDGTYLVIVSKKIKP